MNADANNATPDNKDNHAALSVLAEAVEAASAVLGRKYEMCALDDEKCKQGQKAAAALEVAAEHLRVLASEARQPEPLSPTLDTLDGPTDTGDESQIIVPDYGSARCS